MHIANIRVHCIHEHTVGLYICIEGSISCVLIGASWPTISSFDQHKLHAVYVHCRNIPYASHLLHGPLENVLYLQHNVPRALLKIPICYNASNVASPLYTNASYNLCDMAKRCTCRRKMTHILCIAPKTAHRPQSCCMWTFTRLPTASTAY